MKYRFLIFTFIIPFFIFVNTATAATSTKNLKNAFSNAQNTAQQASYNITDENGSLLANNINNIINIALSLLGIIFVLLTIYGGVIFMTARGNEEQTQKAKSVIIQSIIGLIIVIGAYAISYFVFKYFI